MINPNCELCGGEGRVDAGPSHTDDCGYIKKLLTGTYRDCNCVATVPCCRCFDVFGARSGFVTGSRAYGTPDKVKSDIDFCITLSGLDQYEMLAEAADETADNAPSLPLSLYFGNLNLIILTPMEHRAWKHVNEELKSRKPVTKREAMEALRQHPDLQGRLGEMPKEEGDDDGRSS